MNVERDLGNSKTSLPCIASLNKSNHLSTYSSPSCEANSKSVSWILFKDISALAKLLIKSGWDGSFLYELIEDLIKPNSGLIPLGIS